MGASGSDPVNAPRVARTRSAERRVFYAPLGQCVAGRRGLAPRAQVISGRRRQ
jgi:hypothetical protein